MDVLAPLGQEAQLEHLDRLVSLDNPDGLALVVQLDLGVNKLVLQAQLAGQVLEANLEVEDPLGNQDL